MDEVADPGPPGPRDALVRPVACGICGTDVGYVRLGGLAGRGPEPLALGHEVSAIVEDVGAEVTTVRPGDGVVLNPTARGNMIGNGGAGGGLADRLLVRDVAADESLFPVPDRLPLDVAALAEPLGVALRAVDRTEVEPGERVAVFGAGPIGLGVVACLRDRGVEEIVVVDRAPARLDLAATLGATMTVDADDDVWTTLADKHGTTELLGMPQPATDVFIEASGASSVLRQVVGSARRGARLVVVALHRAEVPVSFLDVLMRELTIRGSMEYPEDFTRALDLLDRVDLAPMVTDRFGLGQVDQALRLAASGESAGKVLVELTG